MKIAIASGKGGTGKTTVATNLAYFLKVNENKNVTLLDCDVEEPNSHLFLKPDWHTTQSVSVPIPLVDRDKCTGCGKCAEICQFNALACIKDQVLTFPELCHGCGGCVLVCPSGAVTAGERNIGWVQTGSGREITLIHGQLRVGEALSPPLIRAVKDAAPRAGITLLDCPPGTSCPVIQSVRGSDFVLLVTEPTPFGLNDLKLAVEMVRELQIPFAVGINRSTIGDGSVRYYCGQENIPIILEIPNDREIARAYSDGRLLLEVLPRYWDSFARLAACLSEVIPC